MLRTVTVRHRKTDLKLPAPIYENYEVEVALRPGETPDDDSYQWRVDEAAKAASSSSGSSSSKSPVVTGARKQNQKWSLEEEVALKAGMEKYYSGDPETNPHYQKQPYVAILQDPEFKILADNARENVHLKDKWRSIESKESTNFATVI